MTRQRIYDRITELELYREGLRAVGKLTETQAREIATELRQLRNAYQEIGHPKSAGGYEMTKQAVYDRIVDLELYREGLRGTGKLTREKTQEIATELRQLRNAITIAENRTRDVAAEFELARNALKETSK